MTEDELRLLASRYYDPGPKLYNFLLFHSDVENLGDYNLFCLVL